MPASKNSFLAALRENRLQIGLWLALADAYSAEAVGGAGFDWLVIDGEHAPNDLPRMLAQLQALANSASSPVVRLPIGETWLIKQVLDIGFQTVLVPMVESAAQAETLASAMRYPPKGMRGVGSALARASRFNAIPDYLATADDEVCLLVQVESREGLAAIEEIAAVEGVDGIFIGPSDLAADMGFIGQAGHPEVREAVESAIGRIRAAGKPAGILTFDPVLIRRYIEIGAIFVAVGADITLLTNAARTLAESYRA